MYNEVIDSTSRYPVFDSLQKLISQTTRIDGYESTKTRMNLYKYECK
jgi:hypothetical protein